MAEYGTKEYYKEQIASAKLNKIIYTKALREELNCMSPTPDLVDKIVEKLHEEITGIRYYGSALKDLEKSEGK